MSALHDALRRMADAYHGGRPALALRHGKADEVLRKELGATPSHKLGAVDALALAAMCSQVGTAYCHDYAALVAQECGGKFLPLDEAAAVAPGHPVARVATLVHETSDVTTIIIDAMQDGTISDNELAAIELEIAQAEEQLRKLRTAARAVNQAGKPAHLKASP